MLDDLFIDVGTEVGTGSELLGTFAHLTREQVRARWDSPRGRHILQTWEASGFKRDVIEGLVGRFYDHLDLRGVPLGRHRLSGLDLRQIDFFKADLSESDFSRSDLRDSHLSEANIKGARFDWARMDNVLLDNVDYDTQVSFLGVDLSKINFTLATLLHDLTLTQQRIEHLKRRNPALALFLRVTCDYGLSLSRFFAWVLAILLVFAIAYSVVPGVISRGGFLNALYFSVVTFTTLGYGDILPSPGLGQLMAIAEVSLGYLMGGLLISILARRFLLG